jgi:tetratricopeptide (TPR) repeat protein
MTRLEGIRAAGFAVCIAAAAVPARGNPESEALRAKAADHTYNLEHDAALAVFRQAVAADPQDAGAYRGLASSLWLSITFRRGNMTVDDYLGRPNKPNTNPLPPPPPETVAGFRDAIDKAIALARQRIAKNSKDADAHYQLGAAIGLRASYSATVEGSVMSAFRAAREAYDEEEKTLALQPQRKDAGLIVGTYRYIVAALALPLRVVAYVAGFGGGKEKGIKQIEDAAAYGGDNQTEARFALILLYNREKRYDDALKVLATLRERYPRNRLAWLESGSTALRAGRAADAERFLSDGLARFSDDRRRGCSARTRCCVTNAGGVSGTRPQRRGRADLRKSLTLEGRKWVHARSHLEPGQACVEDGKQGLAGAELRAAITLARQR